jgi:catechol 2,3-dioxygenase-like lactoylglutathione lyase family enzyme
MDKNKEKVISGIQQVGIGVRDLHEAWKWYRRHFNMDIRIFEDKAIAKLMLPYTEGVERERHASLAMNMQGGGGFEIWQHIGKVPEGHTFEIKVGDFGIFSAKIKTNKIEEAYTQMKKDGIDVMGGITNNPEGNKHFYIKDPYNNIFEFVSSSFIFKKDKSLNGGIYGVTIGISDFEKAKTVYCDILGYDEIVYDIESEFDDIKSLPGGEETIRRILLRSSSKLKGPFSPFLGPSEIELVQVISRKPKRIYQERIWGDLGFIHICFDIVNMDALRNFCKSKGYPFTVDSSTSFDMGVAAGHFSYIADPDGTLIEFVETHKLPIIKKLGWYMNLKKRDPNNPLPKWMLHTLAWGRIKD